MTIEAGEVVFADTNVLLCATDRSREHHEEARRLIREAGPSGYHLAVSGQIIREYLVVATRPVAGNGLGLSIPEALNNVDQFSRPPTVFCDEPESVTARLRQLTVAHDLKGKRIHDANVVATMLVHGIRRLITENTRDFAVFDEIETATPSRAAQEGELPPAGDRD